MTAAANVRTLACRPEAFAPYVADGTGSASFQAFLKTRGGDVKYGAGNEAILVPAVDCAIHWWRDAGALWDFRGTYPSSPVFWGAIRRTTADGEGRFRFDRLPPGAYYVRTHVVWEVPAGRFLTDIQGGLIAREIEIRLGEHAEIVLTR